MNNYVEGLRTTLDEATLNMTQFMEQVVVLVGTNADTVEKKYHDTGLAISEDLTDPWTAAKNAMADYEGEAGLGLMNKWLADGQFFDKFKSDITSDLTSPWNAGKTAANAFDIKVGSVMSSMLGKIQSNVSTAKEELQKVFNEIDKINTTVVKPKIEQVSTTETEQTKESTQPTTPTNPTTPETTQQKGAWNVKRLQKVLNTVFQTGLTEDGIYGNATKSAVGKAQQIMNIQRTGKYNEKTRTALLRYIDRLIKLTKDEGGNTTKYKNVKNILPGAMYAKGTMGTDKDEWMLTDELGDELVMYATPSGTLSYARVGTTVIPAEITKNLVEWGKLNPNMANISGVGTNFNMISNAVNKPEFKLDIENFLRCDNVSQDSMPELKKFVNDQMNNLMKRMNYAIKGVGSR